MKNFLNDRLKFQKAYIDYEKVLTHLTHMESRVTDVLKSFRYKREIPTEQYKDLRPLGLRLEIMYGLAKVHKIVLFIMFYFILDLFYLPLVPQYPLDLRISF